VTGHSEAGGVGCDREEESGMVTEQQCNGAGGVDGDRGIALQRWPKRRQSHDRGGAGPGASGVAMVAYRQILEAWQCKV
jgi:hypothetical protein